MDNISFHLKMSKQIADAHFTTVEAEKFVIHAEAKVAVTQATSVTTDVTANGAAGAITTQAATTAAAGAAVNNFTVNNTAVKAGSLVFANIVSYSGTIVTNGIPAVFVSGITNGAFDLNIHNVHPSNALSGTLVIDYLVM